METVSLMISEPAMSPTSKGISAMCARMRSATRRASSSSVCGSRSANSSPPKRPTRSYSRRKTWIVRLSSFSALSPARWPYVSLMTLKLSTSIKATASEVRVRPARTTSLPASRSQVPALSSPVLASNRESLRSCAWRWERCSRVTKGRAKAMASGLLATQSVTRTATHNSVASLCNGSRVRVIWRTLAAGSDALTAGSTRPWLIAQCTTAQAPTPSCCPQSRHRIRHEAVVDRPMHHCTGRHCQYPRRRAGVRPADVAEYASVGGMEGDRGAAVGQSDGSCGEHSPVDLYLPAAPLHQHEPRNRHDQRIYRRQQDRNRQFPDGVHIQDETRVLTRPAGHLHREEAAGQQEPEQQQLAWAKDGHRGARTYCASVKDSDRDDEHNQPAGIYPPDWPRADSQRRAHSMFAPGEAHELLRDELAGVLAEQRMADFRGVAPHCGRLCALFVKASLLTVNRLYKAQSSDRTVTSCHNLCKLAAYWSDVGEHAH